MPSTSASGLTSRRAMAMATATVARWPRKRRWQQRWRQQRQWRPRQRQERRGTASSTSTWRSLCVRLPRQTMKTTTLKMMLTVTSQSSAPDRPTRSAPPTCPPWRRRDCAPCFGLTSCPRQRGRRTLPPWLGGATTNSQMLRSVHASQWAREGIAGPSRWQRAPDGIQGERKRRRTHGDNTRHVPWLPQLLRWRIVDPGKQRVGGGGGGSALIVHFYKRAEIAVADLWEMLVHRHCSSIESPDASSNNYLTRMCLDNICLLSLFNISKHKEKPVGLGHSGCWKGWQTAILREGSCSLSMLYALSDTCCASQ